MLFLSRFTSWALKGKALEGWACSKDACLKRLESNVKDHVDFMHVKYIHNLDNQGHRIVLFPDHFLPSVLVAAEERTGESP